jgi:hypothetical protein
MNRIEVAEIIDIKGKDFSMVIIFSNRCLAEIVFVDRSQLGVVDE